jgi:hypothetical protein
MSSFLCPDDKAAEKAGATLLLMAPDCFSYRYQLTAFDKIICIRLCWEKLFRNLHGIFNISLYFCGNYRIATKFKCFDDNFYYSSHYTFGSL